MKFENLTALYEYFDNLVMEDADADTLFASSYLRGFIALAASETGTEQQALSSSLAEKVSEQVRDAKSELSPQDQLIVHNYWQSLLPAFTA
ncbi:YfcL family protein [Thalassotalea euphylliae]|uniref:YfcL family protein n=1 Tax=Thalassotalea euphylliae TaxID=1655234 RepID=UPI0036291A6C